MLNQIRWADGNTDLLSHPYPLPRGHIVVVCHIRASYRVPSLSLYDIRASHSRDTFWPWKFKVQGQGQMYPSQRSVKWTNFFSVSHQPIQSTTVSSVPWQSGLPFLRQNSTLKIQCQRSRSMVKDKGTLFSVASKWLISFFGPTIPKIWQIGCSTGENGLDVLQKKIAKLFLTEFLQYQSE